MTKTNDQKAAPKGAGGYDPTASYRVDLNRTVMYHKIALRPGPNLIISGAILNAIPQDAIIATNRV